MVTAHPGLRGGALYLDYNATTPVDPAVAEAMAPYLAEAFGNPSSEHPWGAAARMALDQARSRIAGLIGAQRAGIVLTGSGSEADNLAVRGAVLGSGIERPHVVTQATEHPAVLEACRALQRWHGAEVTVLPVDGHGVVDPADVAAALTPRTVLVSVMAANNETGALQPIAEVARIARDRGCLFHCDAAQAAGKIPLDASAEGVDLMTVVGHKMYAPKGVAALYVRPGVALEPIVYGGGQERGRRAGTENVSLAVGLGAAARLAADELSSGEHHRIRKLRDQLHSRLRQALPGRVLLNGPVERRLPGTLNISITGTRGHTVLGRQHGIAASTGSACHGGGRAPSPVLTAMGMDGARAAAALRLSLGRWTTEGDIDRAVALLTTAVRAGGS